MKTPKVIPIDQWKWFGTSAHFICGRWCRFHLATQIGAYLVSTIGEYVHPSDSGGSEGAEAEWLEHNWPGRDVGLNRKYETMVFRAGKRCNSSGCKCGLPTVDGREIDAKFYNERGAATKGHFAMCLKFAGMEVTA